METLGIETLGMIGAFSAIAAALSIGIGAVGSAIGEGLAAGSALQAMAQQPDEANNVTRILFVSMAMIESTAIYSFVVSMILLFANPFWTTIKDAVL